MCALVVAMMRAGAPSVVGREPRSFRKRTRICCAGAGIWSMSSISNVVPLASAIERCSFSASNSAPLCTAIGLLPRRLLQWITRAQVDLPLPRAPSISTVASPSDARLSVVCKRRISGLLPTSAEPSRMPSTIDSSCRISRRICSRSSRTSTSATPASPAIACGNVPRLSAADEDDPLPSRPNGIPRSAQTAATSSAIVASTNTRSGRCSANAAHADSGESHNTAWWPLWASASAKVSPDASCEASNTHAVRRLVATDLPFDSSVLMFSRGWIGRFGSGHEAGRSAGSDRNRDSKRSAPCHRSFVARLGLRLGFRFLLRVRLRQTQESARRRASSSKSIACRSVPWIGVIFLNLRYSSMLDSST